MTSVQTDEHDEPDEPRPRWLPKSGMVRVAMFQLKRWRGRIFFGAALVLYVLANMFLQYLSTGNWWGAFGRSLTVYREAMIAPLGDLFRGPLSIFNFPWMIVVLGLILGIIILAPLVVAILYRFSAALVLLAIAAFLGQAPVLAAILACGCLLATRTPLRRDMPLLSALLGVVPVALYLYLFSFAGGDSAGVLPLQRWIPYAPFAVAVAAAIVGLMLIMILSHMLRWRLALLWLVLAIMLAASAHLFITRVGAAQLQYALIASRLGGGCTIFQPCLLDTWRRTNKIETLPPAQIYRRIERELQDRKAELMAACDDFLRNYPSHERAASVLWVKAQCQSLQLDQPSLRVGTINYVESHPLDSSGAIWRQIVSDFGNMPQAAIARWRLGELALRNADVGQATEHLNAASQSLWAAAIARQQTHQADQAPVLFRPLESLPAEESYEQARIEVERLIWLIRTNELAGDSAAAAKMAQYLSVSPFSPDYAQQLTALITSRPDTRVSRNIMVALARATSDYRAKADILNTVINDATDADACVEANYELARLTLQEPSLVEQLHLKSPGEYLDQVARIMPNPWQEEAFRYHASTRPAN